MILFFEDQDVFWADERPVTSPFMVGDVSHVFMLQVKKSSAQIEWCEMWMSEFDRTRIYIDLWFIVNI